MPNYTESHEYAEERLDRIVARYRHHYSSSYYIRRACDSATRRMTNLSKLRAWAFILDQNGYASSAAFARNRVDGLTAGTITPRPRTPRLGRTNVPSYTPVEPLRPYVAGVSMVTYNFTAGEEA